MDKPISYKTGEVEKQTDGTYSASYLCTMNGQPYQALAGQGYSFKSIEAARTAIDAAIARQDAKLTMHQQESAAIFGIGGIGIAIENEAPFIPSAAAIERHTAAVKAAHRCRHCHQTELDGAMFTTAPSSGLCDDCFDS